LRAEFLKAFWVVVSIEYASLMRAMRKHLVFLTALVAGSTPAINAEEAWWPQFRGPNAAGVSDSAKPPVEFGPGTNQLWKVAIPAGSSSPCIWRDRIFLTAFDDGKLWTLCLKRSDGTLLWKRDAKAEQIEEFHPTEGSPAASTPATDGERLVSYFGSCGLICYDLEGQELWRHALPTAVTAGSFGSGTSPLIAKGLVFINRDQASDCSLLAVNLKSGMKAWQTARPDVAQSFGTPIHWRNDGVDEIVMSGSFKLKGYDVNTGKERWSLAGLPSMTCTTPVLGGDMLYFAGWSPSKAENPIPSFQQLAAQSDANKDGTITWEEAKAAGADAWFKVLDVNKDGVQTAEDLEAMNEHVARGENVLIAVRPNGKGELSGEAIAWKQLRGLPYVPSPLYYQGRVYLVKDGGLVSSFDAKTGEIFYQQERLGTRGSNYASPVAAAGKIYMASLEGVMTVLKAGGSKPETLHQADFGERIAGSPALIDNKVYLRTASALYAFGE
jgi:outer membrane protein assembly factor BamB